MYDPAEEEVARMDIRYFIEENPGAQYRPTSVLNFGIGEGDLAEQLTTYMEMRKEGSPYSSQWTACPIVYNDGRWKMYVPPEWR